MPDVDILERRRTRFVFWTPHPGLPAPRLVIGRLEPGNPPELRDAHEHTLLPADDGQPGLWAIAASDCGLEDGRIYHYWFEVAETRPERPAGGRVLCTDPFAFVIDWRLVAPRLPAPYAEDDRQPAGVVRFKDGALEPCDPGGETPLPADVVPLDRLAPNNHLVIYELPTAWTRIDSTGVLERGIGSFRDVRALVDPAESGANFSDLDILQPGRSYLTELGVNALELLPPADSAYLREWGYGTTNFLAADFELGFPAGHASPTASSDLSALVRACHREGIRIFVDMVTAFARQSPYDTAAFDEFHIARPHETPDDPDAHTSGRGDGRIEIRNGFGSTLFRYARFVHSYDPLAGGSRQLSPARQYMHVALARWMREFGVDGIRLDSVENIANWDFVGGFSAAARDLFRERWRASGASGSPDSRFLVVGEELSRPMALLYQRRLDGLWNDEFRARIRAALLGLAEGGDDFEWTVRRAIDCRLLGFEDGAQAINYLTSHDVEGFRRERLFNYLSTAAGSDLDKRLRLAFVCLLTAVGVPMILAGDEFADQHDRFDANGNVTQDGGKQVDPVNYSRLRDRWRQELAQYVSRLIRLRTTHPALGVNDTAFIHVDVNDTRKVLAWRRGPDGDPVVVVANFSAFQTDDPFNPASEYRVHGWPATPPGRSWREITQQRPVPPEWVGREPIFPWEAKVYALA